VIEKHLAEGAPSLTVGVRGFRCINLTRADVPVSLGIDQGGMIVAIFGGEPRELSDLSMAGQVPPTDEVAARALGVLPELVE
jgi:hypothetical protein